MVQSLNMTQRDIAEALGIPRSVISELAASDAEPDLLLKWAIAGLASKQDNQPGETAREHSEYPLVEDLAEDTWAAETARLAFPILVERIKSGRREPITYGELHDAVVGRGGKSDIGTLAKYAHPCGRMARAAEEAADIIDDEVPPITAIVVNGTTRLPSPGIDGFLRNYLGRSETRGWSKNPGARREAIERVWDDIFAYDRWDEVQKAVGLTGDPHLDR